MSHSIRQYGPTEVHIFSTTTERDDYIRQGANLYIGKLYLVATPNSPILCPISCSTCPLNVEAPNPIRGRSCRERAHNYITNKVYRRPQ